MSVEQENPVMSVFDFDATGMSVFENESSSIETFNPKPDGNKKYIVTLRLLTNFRSPKDSIVFKNYYWLTDAAGSFGYDSPTTFKQPCPVGGAYWALFNNTNPQIKAMSEQLRMQKRYTVYVQIVNDSATPANNGKVLPWKLPVPVYKSIEKWLKPTDEELAAGKTAKPLFNPFDAFNLIVTVENKLVGTTTMRDYATELTDAKSPVMIDGVPVTNTPEGQKLFVDWLEEKQTIDIVEQYGYKLATDDIKKRVKSMLVHKFGQPDVFWSEISLTDQPVLNVASDAPSIVDGAQPTGPATATNVATNATEQATAPAAAQTAQPAQEAQGTETDVDSIVSAITGG
jgi:hypothetical protein